MTELIQNRCSWLEFFEYKKTYQHLNRDEENKIKKFIDEARYMDMYELIKDGKFPNQLPKRITISKEGTNKKRQVYSYEEDISIVLKFIAFNMNKYDDYFASNCYAFRRSIGVADAFRRISNVRNISNKYCLKVDISNYFNSIDVDRLLKKMYFVKERDEIIYSIFEKILLNEYVIIDGKECKDNHGAMAGLPVAPFFANVYLSDADRYFEENKILYFRYSDDILIFADSKEQLMVYKEKLYKIINDHGLSINPDKEKLYMPHEKWEFLGFSYYEGRLDLSENTLRKTKAKIKRKAEALRRWQRKKGLSEDKAAIGFIRAMNKKFYGKEAEDDFTWSRWFFPNITSDEGLKQVDHYMQEYIRYCVTGRHYKGNYRITYEQMKTWGYKSLVHEYYSGKGKKIDDYS